MQFVKHAIEMATLRKAELVAEMKEVTRLSNPMSPAQLLKWVQARGYGFNDLGKDTVKKALKEQADQLEPEAIAALKLRQQAARTSVKKYDAFVKACGHDRRFRFAFQFAGASRTNRWAGRRAQLQNLTRTPKDIEHIDHLTCVTNIIRDGDYDALGLYVKEPMNALAGCVRSSIRARPGKILRVCDLSSIESLGIAWLSDCERLMNVFRNGLDPYKDFAQVLFRKTYDDVTKHERGLAKAPVLGCGYRLSGGELTDEGKKTGLWAYAESMGIEMSRDQAHEAVGVFRETYPEIPQFWYALENAAERALRTGRPQTVGHLTFEYMKPYLAMRLPSGRRMYYHLPRITKEKRQSRDGSTYEKKVLSYMGQDQVTKQWTRLPTHGGKMTEQATQGTAREFLKHGLLNAHNDGFNIILHVHDEIGAEEDRDDDYHTVERLKECMTAPIPWAPGLPIGASGYENTFYIKD
jgi:DNA polymerase